MGKPKGKTQVPDLEGLKDTITAWVDEDREHRVAFTILGENDDVIWKSSCNIEGETFSLVEVAPMLSKKSKSLEMLIRLMKAGAEVMGEYEEPLGN